MELPSGLSEDMDLVIEAAVKESDCVVRLHDAQDVRDASALDHGTLVEQAFVERENAEWLDILANQTIMKKILRAGQDDTRPELGQRVVVHFVATVPGQDAPVESTREGDGGQPMSFVLGDGDVISAFDLAIPLMNIGELALVRSEARFVYGSFGWPPRYPPNTSVEFEIELLSAEETKLVSEMTLEERMAHVSAKKERGNFWFSVDNTDAAANSYLKAINYLPKDGSLESATALKVTLLLNLASTFKKGGDDLQALEHAQRALQLDPNNVKGLFRTAQIHLRLNNFDDAMQFAEQAARIEPGNAIVRQLLDETRASRRAFLERERNSYKNMFNSSPSPGPSQADEQVEEEQVGAFKKVVNSLRSNLVWMGGSAAAVAGVAIAYWYAQPQVFGEPRD